MDRRLPKPRTDADEYAAAQYDRLGELLNVVGDLAQVLRDRLPQLQRGEPVTGSIRLTEPATPVPLPAEGASTQLVEPAPSDGPMLAEPESVEARPTPPRSGRGSGLDPWRTFADLHQVQYAPEASRDDIIAACVRAGLIDGK